MPLSAGTRLGPYEILAPLGAGGMGEVYRARDTRLSRTVAVKVLAAHLTVRTEARERFEREARAISSLNHPHICSLYDIGRQDDVDFLVMEYLEGGTLGDRLQKGALPQDQALRYAGQILDALDRAHRNGIVHRDLKPANVMLTRDGAKLLDFGLAKLRASVATSEQTASMTLTTEGTIVGTFQYMAPEQLEGKDADVRTDIFAFGAVLYEMLTGRRAFTGKSQASLISSIMTASPPAVSSIQPMTPRALEHLLHRCLEKDPNERWQSVHDLGQELKWIAEGGSQAGGPAPVAEPRKSRARFGWAVASVLAVIAITLGVLLWRATRPVEHPLTRLSLDLGLESITGRQLKSAISPDGRRLVFPARGPDGRQRLASRLLDQTEANLLQGTEDGAEPFFSPDGQWIGFFAGGQLKKISVQGGAAMTLASTLGDSPFGGSWGDDGQITGGQAGIGPLWRVPAAGGASQSLTKLGPGEASHIWPQVLPAGDVVLFTASPQPFRWDEANIQVASLKTGQVKVVQRKGHYGRYLPSGHLIYVHQGVVFGVKFDLAKLQVRGAPVPILEDIDPDGRFDYSTPGTFVYTGRKGAARAWQVAWLYSSGKLQPFVSTPGAYTGPRVSPDGRKLAFVNGPYVYVHDLERDTTSQLTFRGRAATPIWAPDGKHVVFRSDGNNFFWTRSDGVGDPQRLLERPDNVFPWSFSPDGRRLAYHEISPETKKDIWILPLDLTDPEHPKPGTPELFLRTPANEQAPRFSPDGRRIAYVSDESGHDEIYVRPFPAGSGGKWHISNGGGGFPIWRHDGGQLFYEASDNRIMVVDYAVDDASFVPGKPRRWSERQIFQSGASNLDLAPDGKRFAVFVPTEAAPGERGSVHVMMLLNFFDELKRKIP